jgi:tripartite-type tricarboxylate transporter receptor subunit TctC
MSNSERRKTKVETPPMVSKTRRTQRRLVGARLQGHPLRVNAADLPRRRFLHLAASAAAFPAVSRDASAQSYPARPITMIVPAAAGGATDVTGTHFALVPYRGIAPAAQDLVAGQIDLWFGTPDQLPLMRAGSIKAYGVTSDTRLALAPDIPTFEEMGLPALTFYAWNALFAPKGTPRDIIAKLNAAAVEALADAAVRVRLVDLGFEIFPREQRTPEALGALVKADAEKWWPIIKEAGIKAE